MKQDDIKLYAFITLLLAISLVLTLWIVPEQARGQQEPRYVYHVVGDGEVLWDIAKKYRPGEDPRKVYTEIKKVNGKKDSGVIVGEVLKIPVD